MSIIQLLLFQLPLVGLLVESISRRQTVVQIPVVVGMLFQSQLAYSLFVSSLDQLGTSFINRSNQLGSKISGNPVSWVIIIGSNQLGTLFTVRSIQLASSINGNPISWVIILRSNQLDIIQPYSSTSRSVTILVSNISGTQR